MPGRTPRDAVGAFLDPLKVALSCVAHAKLAISPGGYTDTDTDTDHAWTLNGGEGAALSGCGLRFEASMRYRIVPAEQDSDGKPWRVTTRGYIYALKVAATGAEVVAYHWHPTSAHREPHLHVGASQLNPAGPITGRSHISTGGRVAFESVIRTGIELGAATLRDDWEPTLALSVGLFELHRSWATQPPGE